MAENRIVNTEKHKLRIHMRRMRRLFGGEARVDADSVIRKRAEHLIRSERVSYISTYVSVGSETDTRGLISWCLTHQIRVAVPSIDTDTLILKEISDFQELREGRFGFPEPDTSCPDVLPDAVDMHIVPGVAFDRMGYRLGYGKGYYDRLLQGTKAMKVGLCFACQIVPLLPHSTYDIPMNIVLTEKESIGKEILDFGL